MLIKQMAQANPLWGAPRIHGELQNLGLEVSERTVSRLMPRRREAPSQSWRTFLDNHLGAIIANAEQTDFWRTTGILITKRRSKEMSELSSIIANGFIHNYRYFGKRVRTLSEKLSEQQFWVKPYPYGNSFGHLTLHIIGNLNHYIGAQVAQTGYVRDRDREFTEGDPPPKEEVLRRLDEVVELVAETLEAQTADSWGADYSAIGMESVNDRFTMFLRCAAHFQHHIGQMIYLVNEHTK